MPHVILEYSSNICEQPVASVLMPRIHRLISQVGSINIEDFKGRLISREEFAVADGGSANWAFVHLELALLSGRPPELKKEISEKVLAFLLDEFRETVSKKRTSVTVELRDIDRNCYSKVVSGTFQ